MHRIIPHLAKAAGVRLSARHCVGGHVFDGETLALNSAAGLLADHDIMHEIGHYVAAAPEQRDLPNYGLGMYWGSRLGHGQSVNVVDVDWLEDSTESDIQEFMTQLLCVYWGSRHNVSLAMKDSPEAPWKDWDDYLTFKIKEAIDHKKVNLWWQAAIRLRARGYSLDNVSETF